MGSIFPAVTRFEPGTAGWEARTLPLCYAVPPGSEIVGWAGHCELKGSGFETWLSVNSPEEVKKMELILFLTISFVRSGKKRKMKELEKKFFFFISIDPDFSNRVPLMSLLQLSFLLIRLTGFQKGSEQGSRSTKFKFHRQRRTSQGRSRGP